ncbi:MAG: hypothetical protein H6Q39_1037, partial [Chloroflexi bacterium]|nr:hypothetical protein [Chloroflexota bacterium]
VIAHMLILADNLTVVAAIALGYIYDHYFAHLISPPAQIRL